MTIKEMWDKLKAGAEVGKCINSGGLGRLVIAGATYVGGFYLNLILIYSPEKLGFVKANSHSPSLPASDISLTAEEYCLYLAR